MHLEELILSSCLEELYPQDLTRKFQGLSMFKYFTYFEIDKCKFLNEGIHFNKFQKLLKQKCCKIYQNSVQNTLTHHYTQNV